MATLTKDIQAEQTKQIAATLDDYPCAAALPYWPIWAAAQFTSDDSSKGLLHYVRVQLVDEQIQIISTDGFRAFRFHLPTSLSGEPTPWRIPDDGLLLHGKSLRKAVPCARLLTISSELRVTFHGGKKAELLELNTISLAGHSGMFCVGDTLKVGTFPNINQLWPDSFSNAPGKPWCFNAALLKDWCTVVEKLSTNGAIKFYGNAPTTPFVMTASYEACFGQHFTDAQLELLLMPIQVRA